MMGGRRFTGTRGELGPRADAGTWLLLAASLLACELAGGSSGRSTAAGVRRLGENSLPGGGHPSSSGLGIPSLAEGPFRHVNVSAALDYAQAIDHLLGSTRDPWEMKHPLCEGPCLKQHYRHVATAAHEVKKMRIRVVLDRYGDAGCV